MRWRPLVLTLLPRPGGGGWGRFKEGREGEEEEIQGQNSDKNCEGAAKGIRDERQRTRGPD